MINNSTGSKINMNLLPLHHDPQGQQVDLDGAKY
jgi:hypothetical protein